MGIAFSFIPITKSLQRVTQRRVSHMSRGFAIRDSSDLDPSEREDLELLAGSDLPCSELAAAYLEVYDEYGRE